MKYTRGQFTNEFYKLWEMGLLLPTPVNASIYSVKYRKNHFDEYSRVTLKAVSVSDALERACYAITYASPWCPEDIDLHAVYDNEENLLWIDESYYDQVQRKHEFRGMERREFLAKFGMTSAAILFGLRPLQSLAGASNVSLAGTASNFEPPPGSQFYGTPGVYNWTVPAGLTKIRVTAIGGGGGGGSRGPSGYGGSGGGGGGCGIGNLTVTPGSSITITVGAGGSNAQYNTQATAGSGGTSQFGTQLIVTGGGGGIWRGVRTSGGTVTVGGNLASYTGGQGGAGNGTCDNGGGGGGAASPTGNGNAGADQSAGGAGGSSPGGGAGYAGSGDSCGRSGAGGGGASLNSSGGQNGSFGSDYAPSGQYAGSYGGGNGGGNYLTSGQFAGGGAVYIVWPQ